MFFHRSSSRFYIHLPPPPPIFFLLLSFFPSSVFFLPKLDEIKKSGLGVIVVRVEDLQLLELRGAAVVLELTLGLRLIACNSSITIDVVLVVMLDDGVVVADSESGDGGMRL